MPNHVHGIVWIRDEPALDASRGAGAQRECKLGVDPGLMSVQRRPSSEREGVAPLRRGSLGEILRVFKSLGTKRVNEIRGTPGLKVWQRNYHERVIRNQRELDLIRQYIVDNPANWNSDPNNPKNAT